MRSLRRLAVGCLSHWILSLLVNQRGVWEGGILCAHRFSRHSILSFIVFMFWSSGMRLAVIISVQDELICVRLVMPRCMFSLQLFLSEIVKFRFDRK